MVIDIRSGRAQVQDVSFPIYDTRGKTMSAKNVSQALIIWHTSSILPHCHFFMQVCHSLLQDVQYTINSSLWTSPDKAGPLVVPSMIIDHNNLGLWVVNFGPNSMDIQSDTRLAEATPLAPDDIAASTGSFCFDDATADSAEAIEWYALVSDMTLTGEAPVELIKNSVHPLPNLSSIKPNEIQIAVEPWPSITNPQLHQASFSSPKSTPFSNACKRSYSFDNYWPRVSCFPVSTST
ncbi:hypothetical protein NDA11_001340 [Ustilago hordei]|uniref:Uncharacterized protein n=1 Tax=Ustilago hordei TaxID=120017 RepID=I2FYC2_USTHO|nr:uncharacterized protein UHO2_04036 [Ustilago hordei]KAJ1037261.1 hypothetical protein NDA10_000555 [Ustilago hordei]KAJ1579988.1 hypothetical protein NDA15_004027 [Ustilago hordei]KAJ1581923.1 hypothetical protein NDA12_005350 [Ustilago hordei]KAJ1582354.1 hypothetical protein NDA11_001340 [Ustilago hordei]KAJ1600365.1 hypothetical protein NDA14_007138 [Ustilago hordei]